MTDRQKLICDHIMHAITTADGQTKFGLSGMTTLFDGKATDKEVAEAVQWLIDNNYLRMLGAYVFGIGVAGGLDSYDLSSYDPFAKLPKAYAEKSNHTLPIKTIGQRVCAARKHAGLSQEALAELLGIHQTKVSAIETGDKAAAPNAIETISSATGVKREWLLSGRGEMLTQQIEEQAEPEQSNEPVIPAHKGPLGSSSPLETSVPRASDGSNPDPDPDDGTVMPIAAEASQPEQPVFSAIAKLEQQLTPIHTGDAEFKCDVLSRLAPLLDPSISEVLESIRADYQRHIMSAGAAK